MLKFGTVTNINPMTAKARVQFADDNITSYWLPILQKKTLKDFLSGKSIKNKITLNEFLMLGKDIREEDIIETYELREIRK